MDLGGSSLNSASYGGKPLQSPAIATQTTTIYESDGKTIVTVNRPITMGAKVAISLIAVFVPLSAAAAGVFIYLRRRFR